MANPGRIVEFLGKLNKPASTAHLFSSNLRKANILPATKSGNGAAAYTTRNAVDLTVATLVASSNSGAAETAKAVRAASLRDFYHNPLSRSISVKETARAAFAFVQGFIPDSTRCLQAGDMIDAIVDAMRSGAFDEWRGSLIAHVTVEFFDEGRSVQIFVDQPQVNESAVFGFGEILDPERPTVTVFRTHDRVWRDLAAALGPPPIPPPPY